MSNCVMNRLAFGNVSSERFAEIKAEICDERGRIDFERILPMPESLNMAAGSLTNEAVVAYLTDYGRKRPEGVDKELLYKILGSLGPIVFERALEKLVGDPAIESKMFDFSIAIEGPADYMTLDEAGRQYVENFERCGHANWHGWREENWGTPTKAGSASVPVPGLILFETGGSCPEGILKALSAKYPDVHLVCDFADENLGANCGRYELYGARGYFGLDLINEDPVSFAKGVWQTSEAKLWDRAPEPCVDSLEVAKAASRDIADQAAVTPEKDKGAR